MCIYIYIYIVWICDYMHIQKAKEYTRNIANQLRMLISIPNVVRGSDRCCLCCREGDTSFACGEAMAAKIRLLMCI